MPLIKTFYSHNRADIILKEHVNFVGTSLAEAPIPVE
jgi:hypothetical protein